MGDDSSCNTPISIPTIQQFLAPAAFNRLLGAAFTFYISQRPMEFRFCKTPDCGQIYRSVPAGAVTATIRCPSCSSEICVACDDAHRGETCEEYQTRKLEERVDTWINDQGGNKRTDVELIFAGNVEQLSMPTPFTTTYEKYMGDTIRIGVDMFSYLTIALANALGLSAIST
ncbi:hypothetical protein M404DRAFT_994947 [Pisolithus tinctorius Marx 270]|uniref:IBR domain-containing protein n=1 Tax=Pisolithus tinctorius Marx 270 TaxID=870435 RepID=A0A0C3KNU1_PISTI|nr:hypothetical protein M404DRAFT_994947 [Pisolithus tinctorius Marx 270]